MREEAQNGEHSCISCRPVDSSVIKRAASQREALILEAGVLQGPGLGFTVRLSLADVSSTLEAAFMFAGGNRAIARGMSPNGGDQQ